MVRCSHRAWRGARLGGSYPIIAVLGAVLLASALLKLRYPTSSATIAVEQFHSRWFEAFPVVFECAIGFWFLSGVRLRFAWWSALFIFGSFAAYASAVAIRGFSSCGCFGETGVSPWVTLSFDLLAIAALCWRPWATQLQSGPGAGTGPARLALIIRSPFFAIFPAVILLGFSAGIFASDATSLAASSHNQVRIFKAGDWIGAKLPLLQQVDIGEQLRHGAWRVLLYHHDCAKCQEVLLDYQRSASQTRLISSVATALIELPPYQNPGARDSPDYRIGRLEAADDWIIEAPLTLRIEHGRIVAEPVLR